MRNRKHSFIETSSIILFTVVFFIILLIVDIFNPSFGFFSKVETGYVGVASTFGKVSDMPMEPGFHVKNFFTHVNLIDTRTRKTTGNFSAFSSDIQQVDVVIAMNFSIDKVNAITLYKEIGSSFDNIIIAPRLIEATKVVMSRYNAESIIANREILSNEVLAIVREDLAPYGINATAIAIEDIDFTDAFTNAVEAKQVATQEKLTAQTEQERLTMQAQAEAKRKMIDAEARAEIAKVQADADAYAVQVSAEAEAEANRKISGSLTTELIDYNKIQQWDGKLPMLTGGSTPIIDFCADSFDFNN